MLQGDKINVIVHLKSLLSPLFTKLKRFNRMKTNAVLIFRNFAAFKSFYTKSLQLLPFYHHFPFLCG